MAVTVVSTDYRNLRLVGDDEYSIETRAAEAQRSAKGTLCERCALQSECKTLRTLKRVGKQHTRAVVASCQAFAPALKFNDVTGTDCDYFNTFRFGTAWASRVRVGQKVGLVDGSGVLYGFAEVVEVKVMEKDDAFEKRAYMNHLMIGRNKRSEAPSLLRKILRNLYGKLVTEANTHITVISLNRL